MPSPTDDADVRLAQLMRTCAKDRPHLVAPADVAAEVLARIPAGTERALLALLLPRYVGATLRRSENVPARISDDTVWGALLRERVPTAAGYQFLADCSAADSTAGAQRRRDQATNLN